MCKWSCSSYRISTEPLWAKHRTSIDSIQMTEKKRVYLAINCAYIFAHRARITVQMGLLKSGWMQPVVEESTAADSEAETETQGETQAEPGAKALMLL